MADTYNIYQICPQCEGKKVINSTPGDGSVVCPACGGVGERLWGRMAEEEVE